MSSFNLSTDPYLNSIYERIKDVDVQINNCNLDIEKCDNKIDNCNLDIEKCDNEINNINTEFQSEYKEDLQNKKIEIDELKARRKKLTARREKLDDEIDELTARRKKLTARREKLDDKIDQHIETLQSSFAQLNITNNSAVGTPANNVVSSSISDELQQTITDIVNSNIDIIVGETLIPVGTTTLQISNSILNDNTNYSAPRVLNGIPMHVEPALKDFDWQTLLQGTSEAKCQTQLNNIAPSVNAVGSSNGELYTFFTPRKVVVNQNLYLATPIAAKVDFLSKCGPMILEIKANTRGYQITNTEFDVLQQTLSRLYRLRSSYAQLKFAIGFAVTSRVAWTILFERDERFKEKFSILRISHDSIFPIWTSFSHYFTSFPNSFLMPHAQIINNSLIQLGMDPSLCVVRIQKSSIKSSHKVYQVYLPQLCQYNNALGVSARDILCVLLEKSNFCIKIHQRAETYRHESDMIERVKNGLPDKERCDFYARVCLPFVPFTEFQQTLTENNNIIHDKSQEIISILGSTSNYQPPNNFFYSYSKMWNFFSFNQSIGEISGGVIIMYPGKVVNIGVDNIKEVISGVQNSLIYAHRVNVCQGDIRESNILKFENGFQLIDYDNAVIKETVRNLGDAAIYENRGDRFSSCPKNAEVTWETMDDYQMLIKFITKFISQSPLNENSYMTPSKFSIHSYL